MYPSSDRRRLVPVQHPLQQQQHQPLPGNGGYLQHNSVGQPMTGEPGGFVMPVVQGGRDSRVDGGFGQSPLGFVMPAPQHSCYPLPTGSMSQLPLPPPMGEPGGFFIPGTAYARPPQQHQHQHYQHQHHHQQQPLSPALSALSSMSTAAQYPYASHAVEPQLYSPRNSYLSPAGSVSPLAFSGPPPGARNAPSRQESRASWHSGASRQSAASATVVGAHLRPKHYQQQQPQPQSGPTYHWGDV